jgi:predicted HicB family RNase H-like nuclease
MALESLGGRAMHFSTWWRMRYHATSGWALNHYTYRAEWCPEQREYVVRCIELQGLSRGAPTLQEAISAVGQAVDEFIAERKADGGDVPVPLTERQYGGKFVVRTSPALHARLAIEAAEQNVSMNHLMVQKLSGRPSRGLGDLFGFD